MTIIKKLFYYIQVMGVLFLIQLTIVAHGNFVYANSKVQSKTQPKIVKLESQIATHANESEKVLNITFLPESQIKIVGDSTLRKFSAQANISNISGQAKEIPIISHNLPWTPTELTMDLPVQDLQSGESLLDEHMHENLKFKVYPQIQLKLTSFHFIKDDKDNIDLVKASGSLTVAGRIQPIELQARLMIEGKNLRLIGTKTVLMSDFGITPPTMMMGTMKTRDQIEINYNIVCLVKN